MMKTKYVDEKFTKQKMKNKKKYFTKQPSCRVSSTGIVSQRVFGETLLFPEFHFRNVYCNLKKLKKNTVI